MKMKRTERACDVAKERWASASLLVVFLASIPDTYFPAAMPPNRAGRLVCGVNPSVYLNCVTRQDSGYTQKVLTGGFKHPIYLVICGIIFEHRQSSDASLKCGSVITEFALPSQ